jgi:cytochrome c oxidase subunit 1
MPSQSWFPLLAAMALLTGGLFFTNHNFMGAIAGGVVLFVAVYLWAWEGPGGYHLHLDKDGNPIEPKDGQAHH